MKSKLQTKLPESPIATFVRVKRKELGYTQQQFALRVGVGLMFLRDLEQGKQSVRMDKVNEVLGFFGYQTVAGLKENQQIKK
jgi:y4mF family transcriptional regulator